MTDLREVSNCDLDADGILHRCKFAVPVNCNVEAAIAAHVKSLAPWDDPPLSYRALEAVILAATPTIADSRRQLDYLDGLPDIGWPAGNGEWEKRQAAIDGIRRSIAWRQAG